MINILIPMAGLGSRFVDAGYEKPKPFIEIAGKPMIMRVLENLSFPGANYILIGQKAILEKEVELIEKIKKKYQVNFIAIDKLTEGTACTVLHARGLINNDNPLIIANSDQLVDLDIVSFFDDCLKRKLDGEILTFKEKEGDPKWSFAKLDDKGMVVEVKEKKAISDHATVGIYLFRKGRYFVEGAIDMIVANDRVNNEFYTCPVYNYLIKDGRSIGIYEIEKSAMHGLGTPDDLNREITSGYFDEIS